MKNAVERTSLGKIMKGAEGRDDLIQEALTSPQFLVESGGGPTVTNCMGVPWSGAFVNANGDLTVDLRSDIAAESRAKIVYEHLMQFTDDPSVKNTLGFLMTREIAHMQMFTAALATVAENFPPGVLEGDPRSTHTYFNMSDTESARGPWNEGAGPWLQGQWAYIEDPVQHVHETRGLATERVQGSTLSIDEAQKISLRRAQMKSEEVKRTTQPGGAQWSTYSGRTLKQGG